MKKILFISIVGIIISCSSTNIGTDKKYFNENNIEITKSEYNRSRSTNKLLDIPGDSANHRKLALREERGKITNRPILESLLEKETNRQLDPDKPIVIIYYPGKDPCNSSAFPTEESVINWFKILEDGITQIAQIRPIYIYKDKEGLEKYSGILTWHKDPEETVEKLFFKYHYPCSSFVVISKNGDYISYFGEFGKEYVWEATQLMKK